MWVICVMSSGSAWGHCSYSRWEQLNFRWVMICAENQTPPNLSEGSEPPALTQGLLCLHCTEDFREHHSLASCREKTARSRKIRGAATSRGIPNMSKGHCGHERGLLAQPTLKNFSCSSGSAASVFFKQAKKGRLLSAHFINAQLGNPKDVEQK